MDLPRLAGGNPFVEDGEREVGGVLRIRGASPSHHEIRDTWIEQRGNFQRDRPPGCFFLAVRVRVTPCSVRPSVRPRPIVTDKGTDWKEEGRNPIGISVHPSLPVRTSVRPPPSPCPVLRTNRPSVRPLFLLARGRGACGMPQGRPLSRVPTACLPAERVLQRRTAASGPAKRRPADLHAKAFR